MNPLTRCSMSIGAVFIGACAAMVALNHSPRATVNPPLAVPAPAPSAQRVYIDPQTGLRTLPPSPPPAANPAPGGPAQDWLREIPGTTAGGGMKLDMRGRWRHDVHVKASTDQAAFESSCVPAIRPDSSTSQTP